MGLACAESISWTGYAGNNQWATPNNWYPNSVPGPTDDVTISKGSVMVTVSVAIQSLAMGNSFSEPANLTLYKDFYVSNTFTVDGNGNLFIQTGQDTVTGTFNIAGSLTVFGGVLSGSWNANSKATVDMSSPGQKGFSGCQFNSAGSLTLNGVIALNQSSVFTITGGATASATTAIQVQDTTAVMFDASPSEFTYSGGTFDVQAPAKFGKLTVSNGNVSLFSKVDFAKAVVVPAGVTFSSMGSAVVNMSNGVSGAGTLNSQGKTLTLGGVAFNGTVNIGGGNTSFGAADNSINTLTISGGTAHMPNGCSVSMLNIIDGEIMGEATLKAATGNIQTNGFSFKGAIDFSGAVTIAPSLLTFGAGGSMAFGSASVVTVQGTFQANGAQGAVGISNNGQINCQGAINLNNLNLKGTGSVTFSAGQAAKVTTATFEQKTVNLGKGSLFTGDLSNLAVGEVTAPTTVTVTIGDYSMTCQKECDNVKTPSMTKMPTNNIQLLGA